MSIELIPALITDLTILEDRGFLDGINYGRSRMTFGGEDLYPTPIGKASALGFSIIMNHPFVDGNKRTGHAAREHPTFYSIERGKHSVLV